MEDELKARSSAIAEMAKGLSGYYVKRQAELVWQLRLVREAAVSHLPPTQQHLWSTLPHCRTKSPHNVQSIASNLPLSYRLSLEAAHGMPQTGRQTTPICRMTALSQLGQCNQPEMTLFPPRISHSVRGRKAMIRLGDMSLGVSPNAHLL